MYYEFGLKLLLPRLRRAYSWARLTTKRGVAASVADGADNVASAAVRRGSGPGGAAAVGSHDTNLQQRVEKEKEAREVRNNRCIFLLHDRCLPEPLLSSVFAWIPRGVSVCSAIRRMRITSRPCTPSPPSPASWASPGSTGASALYSCITLTRSMRLVAALMKHAHRSTCVLPWRTVWYDMQLHRVFLGHHAGHARVAQHTRAGLRRVHDRVLQPGACVVVDILVLCPTAFSLSSVCPPFVGLLVWW